MKFIRFGRFEYWRDWLTKFLHQMCDILDTISLNRLFQLRLHVQWDPYKGILAKSLNFGPNVRLFRAGKCDFWSDPPPLLGLNHQLFCRFDWTTPQIRFLDFILGDIFQSKSHPFYQSSKRPQIIRRGCIKSILNTIYVLMQFFYFDNITGCYFKDKYNLRADNSP